jgi:DNA-binding NarL/FixJ family response regulator
MPAAVGAKKKNTRSKKRILIVDDHPMMRQGLAQLINSEPDLEVCSEADTAAQALHLVGASKADLILVDISLPDKNGLELIKDIRALFPSLLILVVSMHDESLYAERVLRAGARGYLMNVRHYFGNFFRPPQSRWRLADGTADGPGI